MPRLVIALVACLAFSGAQPEIDPALRSAVERFFETQAAEDAAAYLALWSRTAKRPEALQLKYIFDTGDDRFLDLEITRAVVDGETARVRGSITRIRSTVSAANPGGAPRMVTTRYQFALIYVREDDGWKLSREGSPVDELATALVNETDPSARAALLAADPDLVTQRLVDALGRQADPLARASQFQAAQGIYERALEAAAAMKNRKSEGEMLQNIANSLYFQRNFPAALASYQRRLALEREVENDEGIASALVGIATVRYASYEYSAALALYLEALALQEKLNDLAVVATTLISTGNVRYLQGDFDAAIADYTRAETLKRQYHDLGGAAMALEGLGRTYTAQGDYASAFTALATLLDDATRRKDVRRQASALLNIGEVHTRLVNLDAARTAYDASRQAYESDKQLGDAGRALHAIGIVELMAGRMPQAEAAYEKSHTYCSTAVPKDGECVARALVGLGFAQASQEKWDPAIVSYRKGIEAFMGLQAQEATARARIGLAEALIGKGEYTAALKEATESRNVGVALGVDDLLWRALVSQSRAQRKLTLTTEAIGTARAAVVAVRAMADAALKRPGFAIARDVTSAYANLAVMQAETGNGAGAWDAVEEMRVRALRNSLASNEREISRDMSEEERAAERALAAELTALHAQRDRERTLAKPDEERLKKLDASIAPLTEKRAAFLQQLFARLPDLFVWRGLAAPAAAADLTPQLLEDGQLVIQFVVDEHELLVLTARRTGDAIETAARAVPLKRQLLAERVARAVELLPLAEAESWRKASAELVKSLPPGLFDQMMAAPKVRIIADDMLWRVPFEALPAGPGYLGDRTHVTYAASLTALVRPVPSTADVVPFKLAVVAAPTLPAAVIDTLKTTAPTWILRDPEAALAMSAKLQAAVDPAAVVAVTGENATEEAVRSAAATASVLHVEGPFRVNAASPLFSSVLLKAPEQSTARTSPPAQNGMLEGREVPAAGFSTRVAVFADPAALTMRDSAAALTPLHWVWRAGGTGAILVRRWAGDEAAAQNVLAAFYKALEGGASAVDALRAAQSALRKATPGAPPAAWAGWLVLSGR